MLAHRLLCHAVVAAGLLFTASPAGAADLTAAKTFVATLSSAAIDVATGPAIPDGDRSERFRTLFVGAVDLPMVAKLVLGRYWHLATPDQQRDFMALFADVLVTTWLERFENAAGTVRLQIGDAGSDAGQGVRVESTVYRERRAAVAVVWCLQPQGDRWRIVDMIVAGTSMISTYHEDYASVVIHNGGSVAALNDALRHTIAHRSRPASASLATDESRH